MLYTTAVCKSQLIDLNLELGGITAGVEWAFSQAGPFGDELREFIFDAIIRSWRTIGPVATTNEKLGMVAVPHFPEDGPAFPKHLRLASLGIFEALPGHGSVPSRHLLILVID